MKYQDPLEPTSNTEYISQYATFSQVEQMQNMAATSELARATSLVGQEVYIKTTNSKGEPQLKYGKVDYVVFENNKAYLAIDESLYSLEDLDTVVDLDYKNAFSLWLMLFIMLYGFFHSGCKSSLIFLCQLPADSEPAVAKGLIKLLQRLPEPMGAPRKG